MYGICPKCNKNNILINLYGMPNIAHVEDMERKGKRKRRIYGSNKYPRKFVDFENCINKLTKNIMVSEEEY